MTKKRISRIPFCVFAIVLVASCNRLSSNSNLQMRFVTIPKSRIAVLDFQQDGDLGSKLTEFAADALTQALFLRGEFAVVDRAQVRAVLVDEKVTPSVLTTQQIRLMGEKLEVDYLLLGKIDRLDTNNFDLEKRTKIQLQISFRMISTRDGNIVGMVTDIVKTRNDLRNTLHLVLAKMAGKVTIKRG